MQTMKLVLGAGVVALIACSSQLANLGGNDAGQSPTPDAAAGGTPPSGSPLPSGIGPSDQLSALSATQQGALCAWLIQQWTDAGDMASTSPTSDLPPGYAGGAGTLFGCNGTLYTWPFLSQQYCVLNLRPERVHGARQRARPVRELTSQRQSVRQPVYGRLLGVFLGAGVLSNRLSLRRCRSVQVCTTDRPRRRVQRPGQRQLTTLDPHGRDRRLAEPR